MGGQGGFPGENVQQGSRAGGQCQHCGGGDIVTGVRVNQTSEVLRIGLAYKTGFLVVGCEPLHADLCRVCGTVSRFFVKETNRNWLQD